MTFVSNIRIEMFLFKNFDEKETLFISTVLKENMDRVPYFSNFTSNLFSLIMQKSNFCYTHFGHVINNMGNIVNSNRTYKQPP